MNKRFFAAAILILLTTINIGTVSALTDSDLEISLAVAKKQAMMYDAKIKNDWSAMYSLLTDDFRTQRSYEVFVTDPHMDDDNHPKKISGANSPAAERKKEYLPPHLGYRLTDFYISQNRNMVRVVSKVTSAAPQFLGPITNLHQDEEFWIKSGDGRTGRSGWKAQWDTKYLIHASGAATSLKTPKLPNFTTHVKAPDIARHFVNEALKLPPGQKRNDALEKGIAVDVFAVVETLAEKKIDATSLLVKQINRQMLANPDSMMYFEQMMKAGRWLSMAGDHESSYRNFHTARGLDRFKEEAHAALSNEAIRLGKLEKAARHNIDLLKLTSITKRSRATLLERQLAGICEHCEKLSTDTKIDLAKNLLNAQKWKAAYNLFNHLLKEEKSWGKAVKKLKAGKSVEVREAVGEIIAGITDGQTFDELNRLLNAGGINLYHPGDIPEHFPSIKGSLIIESVPKVRRANYKEFYKLDWQPAKAVIKWSGMDSSKETTTHGGYLVVTLKKGSAPLEKFYPDRIPTAAGSEQLIRDIKKLKRGESIILARVPFSTVTMEHFTAAALSSIGVDAGLLQGSFAAQLIIGAKGMPIGSAKVYSGKHAIKKVFMPPNVVDAKKQKTPAVTITGIGEKATISYRSRGR